jgi:hypothetical protein
MQFGNRDGTHCDCSCSSSTNRLITSKDHASVQLNVGHLDANGIYTGQFTTFALCGNVRAQVRQLHHLVYHWKSWQEYGLTVHESAVFSVVLPFEHWLSIIQLALSMTTDIRSYFTCLFKAHLWLTTKLIIAAIFACREMLTVPLIDCGQRRKLSLGSRVQKGCLLFWAGS